MLLKCPYSHRFDPRYIRVLKRREAVEKLSKGCVEAAQGIAVAIAVFGLGTLILTLALLVGGML